jgi:hypothetical protein
VFPGERKIILYLPQEDHAATQSPRSEAANDTVRPGIEGIMQQLESLQKLKGRKYNEADAEKTQWEDQTESIIEAAFGNPSSELKRFYVARSAGSYNVMGISPAQQQHNFDQQVQELDSLLQALIATLRLQLPEEEVKGVYDAGDEYAFYRDLSALVQAATQDILIVDAYLDENLFNLYVSKVPDGVPSASSQIASARTWRRLRGCTPRAGRYNCDRAPIFTTGPFSSITADGSAGNPSKTQQKRNRHT